MTRTVKIPGKMLPILDTAGQPTGKEVRAFDRHLQVICENFPQRTETATFLIHSIREKVDALTPESCEIEFEQPEIDLIFEALDMLRKNGQLFGSGWYYLSAPLREAQPVSHLYQVEPIVKPQGKPN